MELSLAKLQPVRVDDPRIMFNSDRYYTVLVGGKQVTYKPYTTLSVSTTSIQFSCPPPSPGIIVDRKVSFLLPVRLTFSGTAPPGQLLLQPGYDAPRAFPISGSINTLNVTLNNTSVSINMADVIHALLRYNTDDNLKRREYSTTPTCLDSSRNYHDLFGSMRNPLATYGDCTEGSVIPRGGFPFHIVSNTNTTAVVDMVLTENFFLSPFYFGHGNADGFIGLQTMDINITFVNEPGYRMWSHDNTNFSFDSITASFGPFNQGQAFSYPTSQPEMLFTYISPKELDVIPKAVDYPYFVVDRYPTVLGQVSPSFAAPGFGITTFNSNNIQLNSVPRRMYIYARPSNSVIYNTSDVTDTYLSIYNVSINFNNQAGLLSSATQQDLYKMSVKNHCNMTWEEWSGLRVYNGNFSSPISTVGSVLCVEFGTDIGLGQLEAPGILQTNQLQVTAQFFNANTSGDTMEYTMYIVVISEGTCTITENRTITQTNILTKQDVLDARQKPPIDYQLIQMINGGNFFSGLKKFGKNVFDKIKKIVPYIKDAWPYIKQGISTAKEVAPLVQLAAGAGLEGDGFVGGAYVGGRKMSRKVLQQRLKH